MVCGIADDYGMIRYIVAAAASNASSFPEN